MCLVRRISRTTMNRLPNFFIIGAMKAATSSLHDQLASIDGVFMSDPKELYFFSDDPVFEKGLGWYGSHFDGAEPGDICGESTTHYAKLPTYPRTIDRIASAIDDPKFIYVMRHPIDRLLSQYTHMWLQREITVPFAEAVDGAVPELIDYSRYAYQLRPFFERFGAESVLPVFFDRLRTVGTAELRRVANFIGIDHPVEWNHHIGANNVSAERLQQSNLRNNLKKVPGYQAVRSLVPEQTVDRVRDRWRPSDRPTLTDEQTSSLIEVFNPDLAVLGSWLGIDLDVRSFSKTTALPCSPEWQPAVLQQFPLVR